MDKTDSQDYYHLLTRLEELSGNRYALLKPAEVRMILRCCLAHVYDLINEGKLRGPKGKPLRIFAWSLKAYLDDMNEPAVPQAAEDTRAEPVIPEPKGTKPRPARRKARGASNSWVVLPYPRSNSSGEPRGGSGSCDNCQ